MKFKTGVTADDIAAEWSQNERQRKRRAAQQPPLKERVRGIFVFLLLMALLLFAFNHHEQIQSLAAAGIHRAAKRVTTPDRLRQGALNYEKIVDDIAK